MGIPMSTLVLCFVTACAIMFALLAWLTAEYRRQHATRADLLSQVAAWVGFTPVESDIEPAILFTSPIARDLGSHDQFRIVELEAYDVTPQCIERLDKLKHIENLYFVSCDLTDDDLVHLHDTDVANLLFWKTAISERILESISKMDGLKELVSRRLP